MNSAGQAIAWEIWLRHRWKMGGAAAAILAMSGANVFYFGQTTGARLGAACGYAVLTASLFLIFGCFHFTEGRRKGGFGTFPSRLFGMPVSTARLAAVPMACGALAVLTTYLAGSWLLFAPLGQKNPMLWPSLYLVSGFTIYQTIVWSFPEQRYLKIFLLCAGGMAILFGWMFFLPHMIEGTLSMWGIGIDPKSFQVGLGAVLIAIGPASFLFSVRCLALQRHGTGARSGRRGDLFERISEFFFNWGRPPRTAEAALFWFECRQTILILPIAVLVVLAATFLPALMSAPLSPPGTSGLLGWSLIAPVLLAAIIGRGFAKADFWSPRLNLPPYLANLPIHAGSFVMSKLKVALCSVIITWLLVMYVAVLGVAHAGDPSDLAAFLAGMKVHYPGHDLWVVAVIAAAGWAALSWRFMVSGLAVGLSGNKPLYYSSNAVLAVILLTLLAGLIWTDGGDHKLYLYNFWGFIKLLPILLGVFVTARFLLAAWAWVWAHRAGMVSARCVLIYFACWTAAASFFMWGAYMAFPNTGWLRGLACLASLLILPLATPALAMILWTMNRNGSGLKSS